MRSLISDALDLAKASTDFKEFRKAYHARFRRAVICDSRETVPATLAVVWLAAGDPWEAVVLSANFGRDSDTIGCMAGGICGALAGLDGDNAAKIARLSPPVLADQHRLAGELVSLHRRKARAETAAWANSI